LLYAIPLSLGARLVSGRASTQRGGMH